MGNVQLYYGKKDDSNARRLAGTGLVLGGGAATLGALNPEYLKKIKLKGSTPEALKALEKATFNAKHNISSKKGLGKALETARLQGNVGLQKVRVGARKNLSNMLRHMKSNPKSWAIGGLGAIGAGLLLGR